jgi:ribose transport system substrate-binding protein
MRAGRLSIATIGVFLLGALATGCGGGSSSTNTTSSSSASSGSESSGAILKLADKQVNELYKGTYTLPTGSITPAEGKTIWAISAGQQALSPVNATKGFAEAASKLGWKVKIWDGKYDPSQWLAGIRQAVSAGADGIWTYSFDCATVKAAMEEAAKADIPVVIAQGTDCGKGSESVATHEAEYTTHVQDGVITRAPGTFAEWNIAFGGSGAWWLVAHTEGKAKVIEFVESDLEATLQAGQGVEEVIARCPGCEIVEKVTFTGLELGPALQEKAQQALLQHPEANAVTGNYDTAVTSGIAAAIRASGREILLAGGEGFAPNVALVREGIESVGAGYQASWEGWCGVDDFAHIFAEEKPKPCGAGIELFDKEHNLPAPDTNFSTGLPFEAAYEKSWGVG